MNGVTLSLDSHNLIQPSVYVLWPDVKIFLKEFAPKKR